MVGTYPGKNWVRRFISRHPDILVMKPRGLDPKHAQNFNKVTVMEYFDMRAALNLGLSRDGKIANLSVRIKAHLEDPETHSTLEHNPRFSALYGSKRCVTRVQVGNSLATVNQSSTSASTSLPPASAPSFNPALSTAVPTASTPLQPLPSGSPNDQNLYFTGNPRYIF
jgi:hypothetical protein